MTNDDWSRILATTIRHAQEFLADCKSPHPTVLLDELEEFSEVGFYDLRTLCLQHADALAAAGLVYDDEHRLLHRADDPLQKPVPPEPDGS